jgi:hypothetical protein
VVSEPKVGLDKILSQTSKQKVWKSDSSGGVPALQILIFEFKPQYHQKKKKKPRKNK